MWQNILLSISNLFALKPLITLYHQGNKLGFYLVLGSTFSSMAYHLIEHHKHGMPGIEWFSSIQSHHAFINVDRIFACLSIIYFWPKFDYTNIQILMPAVVGLVSMTFSEMIYKQKEEQLEYILYHLVWHFLAYYTLYQMIRV